VNAFIRGVDRLAEDRLPAAIILCSNRLSAIDPAVQRRAADVFIFQRPSAPQRKLVLAGPLGEAGFTASQIDKIVTLTGESKDNSIGFTYSDLTQRLLPTLVLDAYPDHPLTFDRAVQIITSMQATPPSGMVIDGASCNGPTRR
jgi:hypothetical protein